MTFGTFLKQLRVKKGLTQKEVIHHIHSIGDEYLGVDVVTVSRWERGITTPHITKSLRILRLFTNNLLPYLQSLPVENENGRLRKLAIERFHSSNMILTTAAYTPNPQRKNIEILPLLNSHTDPYSELLAYFFKHIGMKKNVPSGAELYQFQIENKLFAKKMMDKATGEPLGHVISLFFDEKKMQAHYTSPFCSLPFQDAQPYQKHKPMAICIFSRFSVTEDTYWLLNRLITQFIATHANIHYVYFYVFDQWTVEYMEYLNAEKISYDTQHDKGAIKVGGQSFKFGLFRIDSVQWLSKPEIQNLLQKESSVFKAIME